MSSIFFTEVVKKFKKNKGTNASENENEGRITSSCLYIIVSLKASQILTATYFLIYGRRRYTSQKTLLLRKYCL